MHGAVYEIDENNNEVIYKTKSLNELLEFERKYTEPLLTDGSVTIPLGKALLELLNENDLENKLKSIYLKVCKFGEGKDDFSSTEFSEKLQIIFHLIDFIEIYERCKKRRKSQKGLSSASPAIQASESIIKTVNQIKAIIEMQAEEKEFKDPNLLHSLYNIKSWRYPLPYEISIFYNDVFTPFSYKYRKNIKRFEFKHKLDSFQNDEKGFSNLSDFLDNASFDKNDKDIILKIKLYEKDNGKYSIKYQNIKKHFER